MSVLKKITVKCNMPKNCHIYT